MNYSNFYTADISWSKMTEKPSAPTSASAGQGFPNDGGIAQHGMFDSVW